MDRKVYGSFKVILACLGFWMMYVVGLLFGPHQSTKGMIFGWSWISLFSFFLFQAIRVYFKPLLEFGEEGFKTRKGAFGWNQIESVEEYRIVSHDGVVITYGKKEQYSVLKFSPFSVSNYYQVLVELIDMVKKHNPTAEIDTHLLKAVEEIKTSNTNAKVAFNRIHRSKSEWLVIF